MSPVLKIKTKKKEVLKKNPVKYTLCTTVVPFLHKIEDIVHLASQLKGHSQLNLHGFDSTDPLDPELKGMESYPDEMLEDMQRKVDEIMRG